MGEMARMAVGVAAAALLALPASADDAKGALSWPALGMVEVIKQGDRYVPRFPKDVAAFEAKTVKLQGYMVPLEMGGGQKRFLLAAQPSECAYCMPSGPDQLVEVQTKSAVKYTIDVVTVTGKFALVRDDYAGLLYRMTDAVASDK